MEETIADIDAIWPLQDDSCLTANAMSYVDDYVQAVEFEKYFDSTLLGSDALYPDLYGATVDWEPVLQRKHAPATQTEQWINSPFSYTASTTAAHGLCLPVAKTGPEQHQASYSSPAHLCTGENVSSANSNLSVTATIPLAWEHMREPCLLTPQSLAVLSQSANKELVSDGANEGEIWVSPEDLVLRDGKDLESMQARERHERDVWRRYSRAEHEIASLPRRTYRSIVPKKRKGDRKSKQADMNRQNLYNS